MFKGPSHEQVVTRAVFDLRKKLTEDPLEPERRHIFDTLQVNVHKSLRLKWAATQRSVSDMVNDAVRRSLSEDAEEGAAFDERADEPTIDFEDFVRLARRRGRS